MKNKTQIALDALRILMERDKIVDNDWPAKLFLTNEIIENYLREQETIKSQNKSNETEIGASNTP